jgi:hypothetical protein
MTWNLASKLTLVEATYMPNTLVFKLATAPPTSANCVTDGGGTWVIYEAYFFNPTDAASRQQNVKAAYALALAAKTSGANVIVGGWGKGVKHGDQRGSWLS